MQTSTQVLPQCESDFLIWLAEYATERALLLDEGKLVTLTLVDFMNWRHPTKGAAQFHFGSVQ